MRTLHRLTIVSLATTSLTAQWQQLVPPQPTPSARAAFGLACKAGTGEILMFGGTTGTSFGPSSTITLTTNQTWRYAAGTWTQLAPAGAPSARYGIELVHDTARDRFVTFGGCASGGLIASVNDQTWELDGTAWTQVAAPTRPAARMYAAMAYDAVRNRTVLYGGRTSHFGGLLADTWEFDGATWHAVATTQHPGARERAAMCWYAPSGTVLLFGGQRAVPSGSGTQYAPDDETWLHDGNDWGLVPVTGPRPQPRIGAKLVFDSVRNVALLSGGMDAATGQHLGDTWQFDGAWTQIAAAATPGREHGMVFDPTRRLVVRFGGTTGGNGVLGETWSFGARADVVGTGCQGSNGVPALTALDAPRLGQTWQLALANLVPTAPVAIVVLGTTATAVPLDGPGMPGCTAFTTPDVLATTPAAAGSAAWSGPIPAQPALLGASLRAQGLSFDAAANVLGLTVSNAIAGLLGS